MISTHLDDSLKLCPSINISLSNSRFWLAVYIQNLFLNCPRVEFHWVLLMAVWLLTGVQQRAAYNVFWIKGIFILHFGTFLTFDNSHWDVWYSIDAVASCIVWIFFECSYLINHWIWVLSICFDHWWRLPLQHSLNEGWEYFILCFDTFHHIGHTSVTAIIFRI